ncbi:DUF1214 domain-containing protein [Bdellovibrio sp. SKB1291214]|uniref:DUF1254 domain-containing protein n=1 Tax=Bdellovibrio sp. SKB1291214 TaxID=1732569 RepID=UPI000B51E2FE|nr:DUF1254 domain-containing protein [Bdellovibrio sp. SKB1291214]UYL08505.1 DUF1214 domain-containing protein [Bdellovibrio sp. SKB1291214]
MRFISTLRTLLFSVLMSWVSSQSQAQEVSPARDSALKRIAAETYIYAYPLVVMATTREVMTAVPRPGKEKAPLNQLANRRLLPNENSSETYPETDTLGSVAWLDVSKEPVVVSWPHPGNRFVLFSLISAWGEVFAAPGTRTVGSQKKSFIITGPYWKGAVPSSMQRIISPTNSVWMVGRVQVNGLSDYDGIYAFQDQMKITPLSRISKKAIKASPVPFNIDVDSRTPILEQVENMDARVFFATFVAELKNNPPAQTDGAIISKMAALGMFPDKVFQYDQLPAHVKEALNSGYFAGQESFAKFQRGTPNLRMANGWGHPILAGRYGTNYQVRALMTKLGLETAAPQDMTLAQAMVDRRGERLNGGFKYLLKFPKDKLPPVQGFWSVSLYNTRKFFVPNSLNRFALTGSEGLKKNTDGSIDIYVQAVSPGKSLESNWLPAPANEDFSLVMRMYWPRQSVLDGTWKIPALEKIPEFKNLSDNLF